MPTLRKHAVTLLQKHVLGPLAMRRNAGKAVRRLEIGPGDARLEGFESFNIIGGRNTDYIGDASKRLPFKDGTFDVVYAAHILEHVAWYQSADVVREWARIVKPGGLLQIFVPDGLKIADAFVAAETSGEPRHLNDDWWRENPNKDPCIWASGRLMAYGDFQGTRGHPNWHLALFSERRLKRLFTDAGLIDVRRMGAEEVRGWDHGWTNLGVCGVKPAAGAAMRMAAE